MFRSELFGSSGRQIYVGIEADPHKHIVHSDRQFAIILYRHNLVALQNGEAGSEEEVGT